MTTTVRLAPVPARARPETANAYYWNHPDQWEPGIPVYDPFAEEGYGCTRVSPIFLFKPLTPHTDDCTGTDCRRYDDSRWMYVADVDASYASYVVDLYGVRPSAPGVPLHAALETPDEVAA